MSLPRAPSPEFFADPEDELHYRLQEREDANKQRRAAEARGDTITAAALRRDVDYLNASIDSLRRIIRSGRYQVI